mgnify:CR=1 FL=1
MRADPEEFVVVKVLDSLTNLAERRLLAKGKMWELVGQVTGFLCHPNIWIREGASPTSSPSQQSESKRAPADARPITQVRQPSSRPSRASSARPTSGASSTRPSSASSAPTSRISPTSPYSTTPESRSVAFLSVLRHLLARPTDARAGPARSSLESSSRPPSRGRPAAASRTSGRSRAAAAGRPRAHLATRASARTRTMRSSSACASSA